MVTVILVVLLLNSILVGSACVGYLIGIKFYDPPLSAPKKRGHHEESFPNELLSLEELMAMEELDEHGDPIAGL